MSINPYNAGETQMTVNGLSCSINTPVAIKTVKTASGEQAHRLPPYAKVHALPVDEYPACPADWMNGSSKASSYFVPVKAGRGMWLDFNDCWNHTHHVAVVISIQGINPISGQKQDKLILEQYRNQCPIHKNDFKQDRFCDACGFKWPAQNYLSTTGTPRGMFWLDGFRNGEGQVRQYVFTEEQIRGIAKQLIGDDRKFAIGIAFFLSKEAKPLPKPEPERETKTKSGIYMPDMHGSPLLGYSHLKVDKANWNHSDDGGTLECSIDSVTMDCADGDHEDTMQIGSAGAAASSEGLIDSSVDKTLYQLGPEPSVGFLRGVKRGRTGPGGQSVNRVSIQGLAAPSANMPPIEVVQTKLEIAAGALIDQGVAIDPEKPEFWRDEPEGLIYVNYIAEEKGLEIVKAGKRPENANGVLEGLKVGN